MARPTKPTGAKVLKGTFRKCRANPDEPEPMPVNGIPLPPKWLKKAGKDEWNRIIEFIIVNKIVGSEGLGSVEDYCKLHQAVHAEKDPLKIPAAYHAQLRAMRESLGLTGSSRAKIKTPKGGEGQVNPFEAFK